MSNIADLDISDDLMVDWLHLPEDTRILGAEFNWMRHCVTLRVAHPDLPETSKESDVKRCDAQFRTNVDVNPEFVKCNIK